MLNRFINLIRSLLMRDKVVNFQSSSVYDEEIENKEIFHDVVGDSPLNHIDWIIENGLEKFNQLYRSYEDGSIGKQQLLNEPVRRFDMELGYIKGSREEKEADGLLRQSLSTREYRLHSPANLTKANIVEKDYYTIETTLRGGIGGGVVLSQRVKYRYK